MNSSLRGTLTIAKRDFMALIASPLFFVVAGMCAVVWSFMYWRVLDMFQQMSLRYAFSRQQQGGGGEEGMSLHFEAFVKHISLVNFLLILAIPALTMRLLAEEKKMRTYDLLLTSPVNATNIAIGKYLAGFGAAMVLVLISFLYPLSTALVSPIQWGPLLASYLGLTLLVGAYVAVGVFASAATSSVMLAVVMALIFNVALWFVGSGTDMIEVPMWKSVFEHLSLGEHFLGFIKGTIETTGLVFFFSLIFVGCFLTQRVIESSRWR